VCQRCSHTSIRFVVESCWYQVCSNIARDGLIMGTRSMQRCSHQHGDHGQIAWIISDIQPSPTAETFSPCSRDCNSRTSSADVIMVTGRRHCKRTGVAVAKTTVMDHGSRPQNMQLTFCHRGHCNRPPPPLPREGDRDLEGRSAAAAIMVIYPDLAFVVEDLPCKRKSRGVCKNVISYWLFHTTYNYNYFNNQMQ
jgi:hypothetical protein